MAPDEPPEQPLPAREPLPPAKRKRLQQCFEHAGRQMAQDSYDYATELFSQCVVGDPANLVYWQNFLGNLQKKYNNNKTGSKLAQFKARSSRSAVKKSKQHGDWEGVIKNGVEVLKINPWDVSALTAMADACEELAFEDITLVFLKNALEANPKDPEVNLQCAKVLRARAQFDQAIACLHRIEQVRPDDEEIQRLIADLAVEKTIHQGGYEDAEGAKRKMVAGAQAQQRTVSEEERLQREIAKEPQNLPKYIELSELYLRDEHYEKAETVLARAFEVSDGDADIRERWEDAQLRGLRYQVIMARKKAEESGSEEAKHRWKRLRKRLLGKELEFYKHRCERFPNNLAYKYDLGLRYQLNGQYLEAVKEFQLAKNDPRRKGLCQLALGQCFQQIKQPRLAMNHYEMAIQEIPDRDASKKKDALHLAGKLAIALRNLDAAEKHLTTLAGLDFNYKDVSALLDKVSELREKEDKGPESE